MAVNIQNIAFKHILFDVSNKPTKAAKVQLEFYNVNTRSWLVLTDGLVLNKGKLAYNLTIPSRISTKNQTIRVVREVLKSGGMPSFRIISATPKSNLPEVIATTFRAMVESDTQLTIDFGKSWLLDSKGYITKDDHIVIASEVPMFELTSSIRTMEIEKDNAIAQMTGLNNTIAAMSDERTSLLSQLSTAQTNVEAQSQQVADLNLSLQTVNSNLASERALRERLETDKNNLEAQVEAQREQITSMEAVDIAGANYQNLYDDLQQEVTTVNTANINLQQEVSAITIERDDLLQQVSVISIERDNLQTQVSDLTIEKNNLEQEKVSFLASISQLQNSVQQEKAIVTAKNIEINNKQQQIIGLEKENQKLARDLAEAQDFSVTDHPNKLSATKVYSSIVNDVIKADEELVNSKYKLSNISLNLKTTVEKGPEGTVFGLLDFESAKTVNSAAISDIKLDIVPSETTATNEVLTMPNILGLTETAVRKVLLNYGLQLDAVYHATDDDKLVAGQAFKQSPDPDKPVEEGQEVIVIFAKPLN
ncbi:MAG: PASTA domain-containing protein [Bacteroidota bacterium]